ncbi:MAG: tetratricopeptide (TPR) repeat protein [Halieaceae bacterium]|jgi:tetratricopeptide (TPR) repeat protein
MSIKRILFYFGFVLLAFSWTNISISQKANDYKLAEQYFKQGEFDKAAEYYLKVYKQNQSTGYFDKYISALINGQDYKTADKALKKEIKKRPERLVNWVTLGDLYWTSSDKEKAFKTWDNVISQLENNQNAIVPMAYQFTKIDQAQYALKAYELGKKSIPGFYSYYPQMADLYGVIGEYGQMIDLYLELINTNPGYQQTVQNLLNRNFDFSEENTNTQLLKRKLLQQTNQHPDNQMYAEMLIWLNLQQSNFNGAFVQVKSLDKRFKENGSRLVNFARLAYTNEEYESAIDAYQVVISKGDFQPYYETAMMEVLRTKKSLIDNHSISEEKEYTQLKLEYEKTIKQFGIANFTIPAIREMSEINAKKLNLLSEAIKWLIQTIDSPGIENTEIALCKIDLGDYLLMNNQIWEAVLYYMQAEKAFKYDELGDKAKLRAAKVYYYTGDFNWALGKLNILKGSTSKLISNDALYLSNLITDNTTVDTNLHPMQMYAQADLWFMQQQFEAAYKKLDTLQSYYPDHALADEVLYKKYTIKFSQKRYSESAIELQSLLDSYGSDILGDDAAFKLGELYENHLNDSEKAMAYYLLLMTDYQDSVFVTEARKRYRKLRGDSA